MGLTLAEFRRLAAAIDQRIQQLDADGIRGPAVIDPMLPYLPDLQRIWKGTADAQLQHLCDEFPGFYEYAQVMERAAEVERQKPSRLYDEFPALTGALKDSLNTLLGDAATLERGYQRMMDAGAPPGMHADTVRLDALYGKWLIERDHFLRDLRLPSAAIPEKVTEYLTKCFVAIAAGIQRARAMR